MSNVATPIRWEIPASFMAVKTNGGIHDRHCPANKKIPISSVSWPSGITLDAANRPQVQFHPTPIPHTNAKKYVLTYWSGPVVNAAKNAVATISRTRDNIELLIGSNFLEQKFEMTAPGILPHNINNIANPFSRAVNCNWSVRYVIATVANACIPASELRRIHAEEAENEMEVVSVICRKGPQFWKYLSFSLSLSLSLCVCVCVCACARVRVCVFCTYNATAM